MTAIEQAKTILGEKNVFGPDEWKAFFGAKVQFERMPDVPWSTSVLQKPEIHQEHFLFLGLEQVGGMPLTLSAWDRFFPGPYHPKLYKFHKDEVSVSCKYRWYFMPVDAWRNPYHPCAEDISEPRYYIYENRFYVYEEPPDEYEIPSTVEHVTAHILYYLLNEKYMGGCHNIHPNSYHGLMFDPKEFPKGYAGVSASRRIAPASEIEAIRRRREMEREDAYEDRKDRYLHRDN